mmetsp:Transcript_6159/g.17925  ORF Transcript_6159/g.17925 Transcript_6159/m.17925 type:complete len:359 (-) Transcript_6159:192-1268(-)
MEDRDTPPTIPEDAPLPANFEKKVISEGTQREVPKAGQRVCIHLKLCVAGHMLDDSTTRPVPIELNVGRGNFVRGLDAALLTMEVGEEAEVTVPSDSGYEAHGNQFLGVPANATLVYTIKLITITDEGELWDMAFETKQELAAWRRARGKELFMGGHFYQAHEEFLQGLRFLQYMLQLSADQESLVREAKQAAHLNIAATSLKLGLEHEALRYCGQVLDVEPTNGKAMYRRAQAYAALGKFAEALEACASLIEHHPDDKGASALRQRIIARSEHLDRKKERFYRRMLSEDRGVEESDGGAGDPDSSNASTSSVVATMWRLLSCQQGNGKGTGWASNVLISAGLGLLLAILASVITRSM